MVCFIAFGDVCCIYGTRTSFGQRPNGLFCRQLRYIRSAFSVVVFSFATTAAFDAAVLCWLSLNGNRTCIWSIRRLRFGVGCYIVSQTIDSTHTDTNRHKQTHRHTPHATHRTQSHTDAVEWCRGSVGVFPSTANNRVWCMMCLFWYIYMLRGHGTQGGKRNLYIHLLVYVSVCTYMMLVIMHATRSDSQKQMADWKLNEINEVFWVGRCFFAFLLFFVDDEE